MDLNVSRACVRVSVVVWSDRRVDIYGFNSGRLWFKGLFGVVLDSGVCQRRGFISWGFGLRLNF
jgi:hypothetical protein